MNFRFTTQRKAILEELQKVDTHPTADEVYEMVRNRLPKVSLGTIYRNLDMLASQGIIQKLHMADSQMRFDGNPEPHLHAYCQECGRVSDIHANPESTQLFQDLDTDFDITGYTLFFHGICPRCQKQKTENKQMSKEE